MGLIADLPADFRPDESEGPAPIAPTTAEAHAASNNAAVATSNAHPITATASATVSRARVHRVGVSAPAEGISLQSGYAAFYDSMDYLNALPNIWSEGTGGAALAFSRTHDHARLVLTKEWMDILQELDGSLRYVEVDDETFELVRLRSVIGACWFVFAHLEGGIWGDPLGPICMRNIP